MFPDIICDERLDWFEKTLLSMYRSYTEFGKDGCFHMTFESLNETQFGGKLERSKYQRAKRTLKELGLITVNGIVVKAVRGAVKNDKGPVKNDSHNIKPII